MNKAEKETLLRRTAPSRQKQAQEYLQGRSPGTMQRYAPDAHADPEQGWVESEETVKELVKWREGGSFWGRLPPWGEVAETQTTE